MSGLSNKNSALHALWDNKLAGHVEKVSQKFGPASMTDGGSTSGYIDLTETIPADCFILGWKATVETGEAWDDDTTATIQVGKSGTVDDLSAVTSGSIAAAGTVGSHVKTTPMKFNETAYTVRVTITGGADFTAFVTAGTPRVTVDVYFIRLN